MNNSSVFLKDFLRSICNLHRQGSKPNIALFAAPRGGSTWVMELLASQAGMKFFDEPLNVRRENVQRTKLFQDWNDLMPDSANSDRILDYLTALGEGRYGHMNPAPFQKNYRMMTNRIVFKIHAIKHMINDVRDNCGCDIVYLLRHPISNTLSRRVFPRLEFFLRSGYYMERILSRSQAAKIREIVATGSYLEKGVVSWCFENIDAFVCEDKTGWIIVTYEELVERPEVVCNVLCERLGFSDLTTMISGTDRASTNIQMSDTKTQTILAEGSGDKRKKYLTTRWKESVTNEEELRCFEILDIFGIDFYKAGEFSASRDYLLAPN